MNATAESIRPAAARWTLILLILANVLSVGDRMLLGVVAEPVRIQLGLSDLQMGLANGFIFVLFHLAGGLVIARFIDRGRRMRILVLCIIVWSVATAAMAFVHDFASLAIARIGVGVAEAAVFPAAMSLIPDLFGEQSRGRALAAFQTSGFLGVMACTSLAGVLAGSLGWRGMFMMFGAAGVLFAVIVHLTAREPVRAGRIAETPVSLPGLRDVRVACARVLALPGFPCLALAFGMAAMVGAATGAWAPAFLQRSHGVSLAEVGLAMGLASGLGGICGTLLAGVLIDRLAARGAPFAAMLRIPIVCLPLSVPLLLGFIFAPASGLAVLCLGGLSFLLGCAVAPCVTCAVACVPAANRGIASILMLVAAGLIGSSLGPLLVGAASDLLAAGSGRESLRHAMVLVTAAPPAAVALLLVSRRQMQAMPGDGALPLRYRAASGNG